MTNPPRLLLDATVVAQRYASIARVSWHPPLPSTDRDHEAGLTPMARWGATRSPFNGRNYCFQGKNDPIRVQQVAGNP